jgi:hypothetical protein
MTACRKIKYFLLGLLLLALLPLCSGATHRQRGWDFVKSAHFDYFYQAERDPFPERVPIALERLEEFYDLVAPLWEYPERIRITYYRYPSREDLEAATGKAANGVAILRDATVHSISLADAHEVAHLFTTRKLFCLFNTCRLSTFWLEGIAMYYTWPLVYYCSIHNTIHPFYIGTWYGKTVHWHARELLLKGELMEIEPCIYGDDYFHSVGPLGSYPAAGSFLTFLLGPGQCNPERIKLMKQFFARINFARSREEVARTFAEVFGSTIEEVETAWHLFLEEWEECQTECYCKTEPCLSYQP